MTKAVFGFDQLRKQLAQELGFSIVADVPYDIYHDAGMTMVRIPGPTETGLDHRPSNKTRDILGQGENEEKAFEDAFVKYRGIAGQKVTARKQLAEQTMHVWH